MSYTAGIPRQLAAVLPAQPAGTPPRLAFRATTEMPGVSLLLMALFHSGRNNYKIKNWKRMPASF